MKRLCLRIAPLIVLGCGFLACSKNSETITAQSRSNWINADPAAITSAEMEPDQDIAPGTHMAAGRLHEMQGAFQKALAQYETAYQQDPKRVGALNRMAMVNVRLGKFKLAQEQLEKAVKIRPDSSLLHNNLGYAHICSKDWVNAEASFREALDIQPSFSRARVNLAIALARQERLDDALDEFRAVVPEADALYNLGLVLRGMKRYDDAAHAFELVLEQDQRFVAAQKQLEQLDRKDAAETQKPQPVRDRSWGALSTNRNGASERKRARMAKSAPAPIKVETFARSNKSEPTNTNTMTANAEPAVNTVPVAEAIPVAEPVIEPVARTASFNAVTTESNSTQRLATTERPVVEETIEVATPVVEEISAVGSAEVIEPAVATEPVVVEQPIVNAEPVIEEAEEVVVSVAPITREESEKADATIAMPSAVVDVSDDGGLDNVHTSKGGDATVVRINTALPSDLQGMVRSLENDAFQAASDGVLVLIDPEGVSIQQNAVAPTHTNSVMADAAPVEIENVRPTALTGFTDTAAVIEDVPAVEIKEVPKVANPVDTESDVQVGEVEEVISEIVDVVSTNDPEEIEEAIPVEETDAN